MENNLTFLGLVGIRDTPRLESEIVVRQCHCAGISVHILTGDHRTTTISIATQVAILEPVVESHDVTALSTSTPVMTATEFDALS